MKLLINKKLFLQSWVLAERSTSSSSSMSILSSVLVKADRDKVTLQATDIRTSIICSASGVNVLEPGEAVFPVKIVSVDNKRVIVKLSFKKTTPIYIDNIHHFITPNKRRHIINN